MPVSVRDRRVAINMYNCNEFLETFAAAIKLRAVPANLNYRYLDNELYQLLETSRAEAVVFHASLAERVRGATTLGLPGSKRWSKSMI
jgi:fatty-acyl-CoA synthase